MKKNAVIIILFFSVLTAAALSYRQFRKIKFIPPTPGELHQPTIVKQDEEIDTTDLGIPTNDDPWKEMSKLVAEYYLKDGVYYEGNMKLLDENGEHEKDIEDEKFSCMLWGSNYDYLIDSMEVIRNNKLLIVTDNKNKSIFISPAAKQSKHNKMLFDISSFKKLMTEKKGVARVTKLGTQKVLTIDNIEDPTFQGYSIYYSPDNYKIQRMVLGMVRLNPLSQDIGEIENDQAVDSAANVTADEEVDASDSLSEYYYYLEINFTKITALSPDGKNFNPQDKFFMIEGDRLKLTSAYSNYNLITP